MGYNTEATVWPAHPVPAAVKALIDRLFNLLDSHRSDVGNTLAEEIFTSDAEAQFGAHRFNGKDGMCLPQGRRILSAQASPSPLIVGRNSQEQRECVETFRRTKAHSIAGLLV